jgi:predicted nucleic acid-binding Zn ribbon protein
MNYKSALCSCLVCHEIKSAKGIFSHYMISHTDDQTKIKMVGNGNRKRPETTKQKEDTKRRKEIYSSEPNHCLHCKCILDYEIRKNKFCSHRCAAIVNNARRLVSGHQKIKTAITLKKNKRQYIKIPYTKISQCVVCNKWFPGTRKTCSDFCYSTKNSSNGGYKENSTRVNRTFYKGYWMHSGSELLFAKILDSANIKWIKNTDKFYQFQYPNGKIGKYYPDFFLPEIQQWVEIKGKRYVREYDDLRQAAANAILIMSHELKNKEKILAVCTGSAPVPHV